MVADGNGSSPNGSGAIVPQGGLGGATTAEIRQTVGLIRRACLERWPVTPEMKARAVEQVASIAANADGDRERLRANEILASMDRANIEALTVLDKVERLDAGDATETIRLTMLPPRLARHAEGRDSSA